MACTDCGETVIRSGAGVAITGSGTATNPYVISSDFVLENLLTVRDTDTVNLNITGRGVAGDPYLMTATATLKLTNLVDIADPSGGPSVGETLVWTGVGASGHWEFSTPPPAPAGAVNATAGISGLGSVGDPLKVEVSGVWGAGSLSGLGADSTIGLPIYIDSAGDIRARPVSSVAVVWNDVGGKPSVFAPAAHSHLASDIPAAQQLLMNVGKVNNRTITSALTSSVLPVNPSAGDLFFFPRGS